MKILTNKQYNDIINRIEKLEEASTGRIWFYAEKELTCRELCKVLPTIIKRCIKEEIKSTFTAYMKVLEKKS